MKTGGTILKLYFGTKSTYSLIILSVLAFVLVGVYAFGTQNPTTFGHSAKEIDLSSGVEGKAVFLGSIDVIGDAKIGNSGISCNSAKEGALRFNPTEKFLEFCDGVNFKFLGGCTPGNISFTTPGYYEIEVKGACNYNFTVEGAGGGRDNGGEGGSVSG